MNAPHDWIVPDWPAPAGVASLITTRNGGVSSGAFASFNLGLRCGDDAGSVVAAAHAGWRGLSGGVIENTVRAMNVPATRLLAYLGPAIGPAAFEVGPEVHAAFVDRDAAAARAFVPHGNGKWLADLFTLGRQRLAACGVQHVFGGGDCTAGDPRRFYSYRRERTTGRMAALIWLNGNRKDSV